MEANIRALDLAEVSTVARSDTFFWAREMTKNIRTAEGESSPPRPWAVFCSPPYALYHERTADMLALIERAMTDAPPESVLVVEADEPFDFAQLPDAAAWDVRQYFPAVIGIWRKPQ